MIDYVPTMTFGSEGKCGAGNDCLFHGTGLEGKKVERFVSRHSGTYHVFHACGQYCVSAIVEEWIRKGAL